MELRDIDSWIKDQGIKLPDQVASFDVSDNDISGGRKIADIKSNQLFTGRFEKCDVDDFLRIWNQYRNNNIRGLKNQLLRKCDAMIKNYRGEVCPIEAMLYTSNTISSSFSNFKLAEEIADIIYLVWKKNHEFISSIQHIVDVWEWTHVINICAIAVGKICADVPSDSSIMEFMHDIFERFCGDDQTKQGCFMGLIYSKKEEFVPDILSVVHDLTGTDLDKILGNIFKKKFLINFSDCYDQLNADMFANASRYARELVRVIISDDRTFVERYQKAVNKREKMEIIEEGLAYVQNGGKQIYDAINMLRIARTDNINQKMYHMLDFHTGHHSNMLPIISYFGSVNYKAANRDMKNIDFRNEYYSACRIALFKQSVISSDELMKGFLSETRPKQLRNYLSGFGGLNDKVTDVKNSVFTYFSQNLNDADLKCAISNYEKLVRKYKHLYNPQVGELFKAFFGYGTAFGIVQIRMTEQNTCLNVIEMIINSANYKKYEDFLYYIAEQGMNFSPTIRSHAREILRKINSDRIKL